jgi:pyruvate formate lyase activating enzyme
LTNQDILNHSGLITKIQRFSLHDGPGIRTVVFLKGCPLRCWWCANPENQQPHSELFQIKNRCIHCRQCIASCEADAIFLNTDSEIEIDRTRCNLCGACCDACASASLEWVGERRSIGSILREVEKDRQFYRKSGGGLTLSGGEPLMQPDFTYHLLDQAQRIGLHTAIETCGFIQDQKQLLDIASKSDLILFDLKAVDRDAYLKYTAKKSDVIFGNLKLLLQSNYSIVLRCPLIPSINASPDYFDRVGQLLQKMDKDKKIREIHLLPYHRFGLSKYEALNRPYRLQIDAVDAGDIIKIEAVLNRWGYKVVIHPNQV